MKDTTARYVARHREQADYARTAQVPGHRVLAEQDWARTFASRPGSDDWRASCSCGWAPRAYYHGETEALAACGRHLKSAEKASGEAHA